ncbi:MAG: tetratricopeptide repeat protein [bacterium]
MIARPQPLGVLPWPAGMLVLPSADAADEALRATLTRGITPDAWLVHWEFVRLALADSPAAAADRISGDDDAARYNRAVLIGGDGAWSDFTPSDLDLQVLAGVAAYSVGVTQSPPDPGSASGEVRAVAYSAVASHALENADPATAVNALREGAAAARDGGSMILGASLLATAAELQRERLGDPAAAVADVDAALRLIPRQVPDEDRFYPPPELWGELHVTRALARQEMATRNPGLLLAVTQDLTEALKVFSEEDFPEQFAACNSHLALAYLVMPMSTEGDRLRVGVAVTSLRAALRVYQPDTHPALWASTQMNLANALQYLPSVHQEENLDEAVQLYEQLLQYRTPENDPLGTARILANQGNALGHLGVFTDARDRLVRARALFEEYGDEQGVATVDEIAAGLEDAATAARGGA